MTWKLQIPFLRCWRCRAWNKIVNRGEWKALKPNEDDMAIIEEMQKRWYHDITSPPSENNTISRVRAREEVENDG